MTYATPKFTIDQTRVEVDVKCTAGDTPVICSAPALINGSRLDLTSYTLLAQIRTDPDVTGGDTLLLTPTITKFSSLGDSTLDQWQFQLSATDTATTLGVGTFAWEIQWTDPSGLVRTLAGGKFTVVRQVVH